MKRKFFAAFLSLCMVMSLVPTTVLAADETGSETRVNTVEEFKAAVATSGTVVLDEDLIFSTDDITAVPANVTLVLDMNGHSITVATNFTGRPIVNNGILTVTGDGTIDSTKSEFGGYGAIDNYGTLTIENGTYKGHVCADGAAVYNREGGTATINGGYFEGCRAVNNAGMMTINNGIFYTTSCNLTEDSNKNKNHWSYCVGSTGTLYFYGGTVTGVQGGLAVYDGYAEVYGGTFETVACGHAKDGRVSFYPLYVAGEEGEVEAHIYGGSYTAAYRYAVYCGNDNDGGIKEQATLYIHDGSFVGGYNVQAAVFQAEYTGNPSITGGTFQYKDSDKKIHKSDISVFLPEGAALTQDSSGAVVIDEEEAASSVASVDGVGYTTFQKAIDAAPAGGTVTLLKDVALTESIDIEKSLTINLNGCTVTGRDNAYSIRILGENVEVTICDNSQTATGKITSERSDAGAIVQVADGAQLTLESGTIEATSNTGGCPVMVIGTGASIGDDKGGATFIMNGGSLLANGYFALTGNGLYDNTTITINSGTIASVYAAGIYHPQDGVLTLNGGTISGSTGVQVCGGTLSIPENSTVVVTATGEDNRADKEGDGLIDDGAAISIVNRGGYGDVGATIAGGTFRSENSEAVMSYAWTNDEINEDGAIIEDFIKGGNFSNSIDQAYLVDTLTAELYSLRNTEAPYSYYDSVEDAQAAGQPGDVVTDLSDVNASTTTRYDVVFHHGNGTTQTLSVYDGATITLPTLSNRGYNHFVGWNDGTTTYAGGTQVKIEKNTTFTAVWSYTPPANPNYKITIGAMENGTVTANPTAAKAGATVTLTATPDEGYALSTLTVTDRFGDAVRVTEQADGTYTFTMPNGQVTVTATFVQVEEPAPTEPFVDVNEGDWFYDAVVYAYQNELMDGVGGNRFAPNSETTRAQLVTILYRLEGEPEVSGTSGFTDVEAGTWYTDAVAWAAANGIVNGTTDTTFAPGEDITREQLVTVLYRYAEAKGYDVSARVDLSAYPDANQIQSYAAESVAWAVAEGLIQGFEDNTLRPAGNATRAQIATILMRFCEGVAK